MFRISFFLKVIDIEFFILGLIMLINLDILFEVILEFFCFGLFGDSVVCVIVLRILSNFVMNGLINLVFMVFFFYF